MGARPIALLTDYGYTDAFAGICRAVIAQHDASIPVIELTHGIPAHDVRAGSIALADSVPYLPTDAVVVAVVDPGVGGERRAVAIEAADGRVFVGPDNGLLGPAVDLAGGAAKAAEITQSPWASADRASDTFHGRDIFAPVAARIAAGAAFDEAGPAIDPAGLQSGDLPGARMENGQLTTEVLAIDTFGNARLAASPGDLEGIEFGQHVELDTEDMRRSALYARVFEEGAPNDPMLIVDSSGSLAIVVNQGDAAQSLRLLPGKRVRIFTP